MLERIIPQGVVLDNDLDEAKVTVAMVQLDGIWDHLLPAEHERITKLLVEKVVVSPDDIEVRMRLNGLETVTRELMSAQQKP
jgi:hypothetical protein